MGTPRLQREELSAIHLLTCACITSSLTSLPKHSGASCGLITTLPSTTVFLSLPQPSYWHKTRVASTEASTADMDKAFSTERSSSSPRAVLTVTGFSCDSSELQSPRSSATTRSNSSQLQTRSSPVSLLSVLLSNSAQLQSHAWEDEHMGDDDDEDCLSDGEEPAQDGVPSALNATGLPATTAPVDVPSVM